MSIEKQTMDKKTFAERAGISVATLDRLMKKKRVRYIKLGKRVLFTEQHLRDLLARHEKQTKRAA